MQESQIILVDGISPQTYKTIVEESLRYAIVSLPFTINRMELHGLKWRIMNIAKGKIAEALFFTFARTNGLGISTSLNQTPFYRIDHRDFILNNLEWDIKNNFLIHPGNLLNGKYTDLPALVPDKNQYDQWGKRTIRQIANTDGVAFLFTFLKWASERKQKGFFDFYINQKQRELLLKAWLKYRGQSVDRQPFSETLFWQKWEALSSDQNFCRLQVTEYPILVIGAYATEKEFERFQPIPENQTFLNGAMRTRIRNRMVRLRDLPAFASLFPRLQHKLSLAHFRTSF